MRIKIAWAILVGILICLLVSCASTPTAIHQKELQNIRKMAVVTFLTGEGAHISHYGGTTPNPYLSPFGPLGLLVGTAIQKAAMQLTLANYSDAMKSGLADFSPKSVLAEAFARLFAMPFETVSPLQVEKLGMARHVEKESGEGTRTKDYGVQANKLGIDTVLEVDFTYGLEIHGQTMAAAVVSADITVINVGDNVALLNKRISASTMAKTWHRVDEFMRHNLRLYKEEYSKACEAIVFLAALDLGINLGSTGKFYWQQENTDNALSEGVGK